MAGMECLGDVGGFHPRRGRKWGISAAVILAIAGISAIAAGPAVARDEGATHPKPDELAASLPMTLVISLEDQQLRAYRGLEQIATSRVSTGKRGYATPAGIYSILQKRKWHRSNLYSSAPMPFMQRITWSGLALHGGVVPDHPASHGCIRLPKEFAKELFGQSDIGVHVIVAHTMPTPEPIEHDFLFQSLPRVSLEASADAASLGAPAPRLIRVAAAGGGLKQQSAANFANPSGSPAAVHPVARYIADLAKDASMSKSDTAASSVDDGGGVVAIRSDSKRQSLATKSANLGATSLRSASLGAAEPRQDKFQTLSSAPIKILITRRTGREKVKDAQRLLAELGHDPGAIDGYVGPETRAAIRSFQEAKGIARTGALTDDLVEAVFETAGQTQPTGHLYVRRQYKEIFDAPVDIRDPDLPIGTHVFTPTNFDKSTGRVDWITVGADTASLTSPSQILDRIAITDDTRSRVQAMLTPGSSLIVSDNGRGRETGKGTDFIVQLD